MERSYLKIQRMILSKEEARSIVLFALERSGPKQRMRKECLRVHCTANVERTSCETGANTALYA